MNINKTSKSYTISVSDSLNISDSLFKQHNELEIKSWNSKTSMGNIKDLEDEPKKERKLLYKIWALDEENSNLVVILESNLFISPGSTLKLFSGLDMIDGIIMALEKFEIINLLELTNKDRLEWLNMRMKKN